MTIPLDQLHDSFTILTRSATRFEHVQQWFEDHHEALPGVPPALVPHVTLTSSVQQYLDPNNVHTIYKACQLKLRYTAELPASKKDGATIEAFRVLTGSQAIQVVQHEDQHINKYSGELFLVLCPVQWPFVTAYLGGALLKSPAAIDPACDFIAQTWPSHFPGTPWRTMLALKAAGLLPESPHDLADYLMHTHNNSLEPETLPATLSPV